MVRLSDFDTIIFDFGGVILDIDPDLSRRRFAEMLGIENARKLETEQLPQLYETGSISRTEFVNSLSTPSAEPLRAMPSTLMSARMC